MKVTKPKKHAYHAPDGHTLVNTPSGPVLVCNETGKATPLHDATLARRQAAIEKAAETNARKRREKYMKAVTAWREEGVCPISKKPTGVGGVAKAATGASQRGATAAGAAKAAIRKPRAKPTCVCGGCKEGGKLWCRMGRKAPQLTLLQLCKKVEGSRIYSSAEARAIGFGAQPYARQKARPWLGVMSPGRDSVGRW